MKILAFVAARASEPTEPTVFKEASEQEDTDAAPRGLLGFYFFGATQR